MVDLGAGVMEEGVEAEAVAVEAEVVVEEEV